MTTYYDTFDIQLMDRFTQGALVGTGGKAIVTLAGAYANATLLDPDNDYASLAQPVSLTHGKLRFAVARSSGAPASVDIYGVTGTGHAFQSYAAKAGAPSVIRIDKMNPRCVMVAPFSFASGVATEVDTGLDFPVGAVVEPFGWLDVKAIDATETIDVGLKSSESGGDANGFMAAVSVGTLGVTLPAFTSSATAGALVIETIATTPVVNIPKTAEIVDAVSLTWTITTGSDTGTGRICIPYMVGVTG